MIGQIIKSGDIHYTVIKPLAKLGRPNANVYLCRDQNGNNYVAKHFYGHHPVANDARGVHNHYGRRRDGSALVFDEIQKKNNVYPFLVKHIDRVRHEGKWIIILEYVDGIILSDFIEANYHSDRPSVLNAINALAKTLALWHSNGVALGDPHLGNAILQRSDNEVCKVVLIDYSQIHHPDFYYCKQYGCFSPADKRLKEDLVNDSGMLGYGFKSDLIALDKKFNSDNLLTKTFVEEYNKSFI